MEEVDAEFESSTASSEVGKDKCSEWTTVVSKAGTKRKWFKIGELRIRVRMMMNRFLLGCVCRVKMDMWETHFRCQMLMYALGKVESLRVTSLIFDKYQIPTHVKHGFVSPNHCSVRIVKDLAMFQVCASRQSILKNGV